MLEKYNRLKLIKISTIVLFEYEIDKIDAFYEKKFQK
jgi:hypothetical protein